MDKKRAAIIATAGVGLLVSAIFLRKWNLNRTDKLETDSERPVTVSEILAQSHNHTADAV